MSDKQLRLTARTQRTRRDFDRTALLRTLALAIASLALSVVAHAAPNVNLLTFQDTPDPVASTAPLTYDLKVGNTSFTLPMDGVTLTVPIPSGATFVSVSDVACAYSAPNVVCSFGTLPANSSKNVSIDLTVTATGGNTLSSTAVLTSTTGGETPSSITQTTTVEAGADLQLSGSVSPNPVVGGGQLTYTLLSTNLGPDPSSNLSIVDTLPPNVVYVSSSGSGWSCSPSGSTVTCNRSGTLANSASTTLAIVGKVQSALSGTLTNVATVSAGVTDGVPGNDTATTDVVVTAGANLNITKLASPNPMVALQPATFTLQPRNPGPATAVNVEVTDNLPTGFTSISASGTGWACNVTQLTRAVSCTRASLASGVSNDITIAATAPDNTVVAAGGITVTNTATITTDTPDPDTSDNTDGVTFTIQRDGADLSIQKAKSPNPVAQGSPLTSTLRATNHGPRALLGTDTITITDSLPAGETYSDAASFVDNGWTCNYAVLYFTCTRPGPLAVGSTTPVLTLVTTANSPAFLTNQGCVTITGSQTDANVGNNCTGATSSATAARADLRIVKTQDRTTVASTDPTITYTLTVSNEGPQDSANVEVVDTIPMRTTLTSGTHIAANAGTGDKGSTGTCSVNGAVVTCNYATLRYASGGTPNTPETAVITITVTRPMADGGFTNRATINSTTIGDPDRSNNDSSVNTTVVPVADMEVQSKTVSPTTVKAGVDATYVITIHNKGPSSAAGVALTDVFTIPGGDDGFDVKSMVMSQGSCSYSAGTLTVSCNVGSMTADDVETLNLVVRPKWMASPPPSRQFTNIATVSTSTADVDSTNDSKSATLPLDSASVDLIVNKADVETFAGVAADPLGFDAIALSTNVITYRIIARNSGPSVATQVKLTDSYAPPAGQTATFLCDSDSALGSTCTGTPVCSGDSSATGPTALGLVCSIGTLEAGGSYTRYLKYRIDSSPPALGDTYNNTVTVTSNEPESNNGNNTASEPTTVRAKADLQALSKVPVISPAPLQFGQTFQWNITVHNNGPGNAYDGSLTDTLPSGMVLESPFTYSLNPNTGSCAASGTTRFTCSLGTVTPGAGGDRVVTVSVKIPRPSSTPYPTSMTNTVSVSTTSVDLVPGNDEVQGVVNLVKSSIAGRVYRDNNNNGINDAGENGISGVTLRLTGQDVFGNAVDRTTAATTSSGNYVFDDLEQANATGYTITENQPSASLYVDGLETAGTAATGSAPGGTVSATTGSNTITAIKLDKDQSATGYNFGELFLNTLSGTVFADVDRNGSKSSAEAGIGGVTVTLTGTDVQGNTINVSKSSATDGKYSFTGMLPGTYAITETQPDAYLDGAHSAGTPAGDNSVANVTSAIHVADANGINYNFGEWAATVSGTVYRDRNRNATKDGGEPGVSSVVVTLSGNDIHSVAVTRTSPATSASGAYSFADLPAGTYTVTETQPGGFGSSTPNSISSIVIAAAATSSGNDFGDTTASLSGTVFFDINANNTKDSGEPGIAGVSVSLTGTSADGASVNVPTTTDANGAFSFADLVGPNGSGYALTETQPAAYVDGSSHAGPAGGTPASNAVNAIALPVGADSTGYLFAERGTDVGGTVYRDTNRNGVKDPGEPGLTGVVMKLLDTGNAVIATTTTNASGVYAFPPQPAASYTIQETQPSGFDSGPEAATNSISFALATGTAKVQNFGESAGSLRGRVFLDTDNDGVQDAGEIGLPGITVSLSGSDVNSAPVSASAVTDASGDYSFGDLLSGTYTITETQPASFGDGQDTAGAGSVGGVVGNDVFSAIPLAAGVQATGYNFGETGSAVTGVVYRDMNRDGSKQPGDNPIAGVTITLKDNGGGTFGTTTTAADGSYLFAGMPAGTYTVNETQPVGYGSSSTSPDIVTVTLGAGGAAVANFADTLSTLAGSVYIDLNNNGAREAGEAGINGVTIVLTGTDATGAAVNRSVFTDTNGHFQFIDLLTPNGAGYRAAEGSQPVAFADGADAAGTAGGTVTNDAITSIILPVNTDASGYTFAELGTTIAGTVYKDVNGNATKDASDPGLPSVVLTLHDGLGATLGTTTTSAIGQFAFAGLAAGNYTVEETQPAGYGSSTPNTVSATLGAGSSTTVAFGETTSSIAGIVWADTNNNGQRETGEPGIAGVAIALTGTDANGAAVTHSGTSDSTGSFVFSDLLSGTYALTETQPAAYADGIEVAGSAGGAVADNAITAIPLPTGTAATGYLFGERGLSVTGTVWLDSDRNGTLDAAETGISAVALILHDAGGAAYATATTDNSGHFSIANVPAGHYTLAETQPAGYGSSTPDSVTFDLVAGGATAVASYGDTAGSVAGLVFNDTNGNGRRDSAEPQIAGVALRLTGSDARGNAVDVSTSSGADGTFKLSNIVGGTYSLIETQPAGYVSGINTAGTAGGTPAGDVISGIQLAAAANATGYSFGEQGATATLSGSVWRDADHDRARQPGETSEAGWKVELYQGDVLVQTAVTNNSGEYQIANVPAGGGYELRFREPTSNALYGPPVTNERGLTSTPSVVDTSNPGGASSAAGTIRGLTLQPGNTVIEQSLPLDPMGVVYDSVSRTPIAGATVTLTGPAGFDPTLHLLGGAANATQITNADGLYQFLLLPDAPEGEYSFSVTPPAGRYTPGQSSLIPACSSSVDVSGVGTPSLVQTSNTAPALNIPNEDPAACPTTASGLSAGRGTTQYFYRWVYRHGASGLLVNNHIAIDPILAGALVATKTTPLVNVSRGDLVPYTITITNTLNALLTNIDVRDLMPPGFAYRTGGGTVNGFAVEPERIGRQLTWKDQVFQAHERKTYKIVLIVGAGVGESEYVNQAYGLNNIVGATLSNIASAAVRVVPDPVFDCSDIIGKVFDDRNASGYEDEGEPGIANVRVVTVNGVVVTTDAEGRFHVACASIPDEYRGSNFVMKLDERTLPSGYRVTTENPRVVRATRGKMIKLNFGAGVHRVVRIEATEEAFEPGSTTLKKEWRDRIAALMTTLREAPSIVRVAYVGGDADRKVANKREVALIHYIEDQWKALHCCYRLPVEADGEGHGHE